MPYNPAGGPRPEDLSPNAFQPIGVNGQASQAELYTIYDRPLPEQTDLFARHARNMPFGTMLRLMGFGRPSKTPTIGHYEEPWIHDLLEIGAVVTPAAAPGDSAVVSIASGAHYNTGVTVGGNARQATYPLVGDVVELPGSRIQAQITAKDTSLIPNRVTLTPLKAADDLTGELAAEDSLAILYNLHAEASGLPPGRAPRVMKYTNSFGLVKHSFGATGFELTNAVYHETVAGRPDSAGDSIYAMIQNHELVRFEQSKSGLLMFGQQADNIISASTELAFDVPVDSTEGFIDFAVTSGTVDTYTVNSYALDDFNVVANTLLNERAAATNDVCGYIGPDLFTEIEDAFTQVLVSNLVHTVDRLVPGYESYLNDQYAQGLTSEPSDAMLSFGYNAVRKNGFLFHLKRLDDFADIRRAGADGYGYPNWAIWHPMSWSTDALSGNSRPTIGYEWKQLNDYSRENVFGHLAGAGVGGDNTPYGPAVNQFDSMKYFLMAHLAFHGATGNQLVVQNPA